MAKWISIKLDSELQTGGHACLEADGTDIVVCKTEHGYHAFENDCPHAGLPLGDGDLAGCVITCPYHGYAYDVRDGRNIDFPDDMPLKTFPIRIDGEVIEVDVDG